MTVKDYIRKQNRKLKVFKRFTVPFELEVRTNLAIQSNRIFNEGKNSSGNKIGKYNTTKPLYVNPSISPGIKFTPGGKPGSKVVKLDRKTGYFKSYAAYRRAIGKKTNFVDLKLSNDLFLDFVNAKTASSARPTKISDTEYVVSFKKNINALKAEGMQDKYGEIFKLTKKERSDFLKRLDKSFQLALTK